MLLDKIWVCNELPETETDRIASGAGISPLLAKIFQSRGITDTGSIKKFLNPSLKELMDPFLLKDMARAVDRITKAIVNKEKIIIYGDYDVDGITSTSILYDFLSRQNARVEFYIPDRMDEGYGFSIAAIDKILQTDVSLVISVDCGITAVEEVKYINRHNIDVVITDHHKCKDELPEAHAVVNPCRSDCGSTFKGFAGVGVVFKLVTALCMKLGLGDTYLDYLDLVAVGTVADVVPLTGENRIIVKYGLKRIEVTDNLGLKTLIDCSGIKDKAITSWSIGFVLAPRINAAGRIGDAGRAVRLLTAADGGEASRLAQELNDENKFRQDTEVEIFQQALKIIETEIDLSREKVIVVAGEGWHHGVIGIVASRITERYYRPCILISREEGLGKGSGRSIEGFNIFKALCHCEDLLEKFGGHELAAGLSLKIENLAEFRRQINLYADSVMTEYDLVPKLKVDLKIDKSDISTDAVRDIEKMAPFGSGNPVPLFRYDMLRIDDIRTVGEKKHLKLRLEDRGFLIEAIGFNMGYACDAFGNSDMLDAVCSLEINSWNSIDRIQMNLKDIKPDKDIILEKNYFYSLDKCLGLESTAGSGDVQELSWFTPAFDDSSLEDKILEAASVEKKVAVLVNSLESARMLEEKLTKFKTGIKKPYKICYTDFNDEEIKTINVIINPNPNALELSAFDRIIFYGEWICRNYLCTLLSKVDKSKTLFYNNGGPAGSSRDEIIPERKDLVAVYQYLKANYEASFFVDDLFILAKNIAKSYKLNMNYFKLKKCIEILDEINVLKKEQAGEHGMFINITDKGKEKANLEDSGLYKRLQALKTQLKEA